MKKQDEKTSLIYVSILVFSIGIIWILRANTTFTKLIALIIMIVGLSIDPRSWIFKKLSSLKK